ncbi:interleukin-1 receptor accessory protein-like, partial [Saccoglossus kowalevskii]
NIPPLEGATYRDIYVYLDRYQEAPLFIDTPTCKNQTAVVGVDTEVQFVCEFYCGPGSVAIKQLYWLAERPGYHNDRVFIKSLSHLKSKFSEVTLTKSRDSYLISHLRITNLHNDAFGKYVLVGSNDGRILDVPIYLTEGEPPVSDNSSTSIFVYLFVSLSAMVLLAAILVICIRHYWTHLVLFYYLRVRSSSKPKGTKKYDVFVSYDIKDMHFVKSEIIPTLEHKWNLLIRIEDRDFLPGAVIAEEIVETIKMSRCSLLILSPNYMNGRDGFCSFQFHMALKETIALNNSLIIIILDDIRGNDREMDKALTSTVGIAKCLRWKSGDESHTRKFWKKLHLKLLRSVENEPTRKHSVNDYKVKPICI